MIINTPCPRTLPRNRHPFRITPKKPNILMHPPNRSLLIQQPRIQRPTSLHIRTAQEPKTVQPVLYRYRHERIIRLHHHLREFHIPVAVLVPAAVDPYQDRQILGICWGGDGEKEAVFRASISREGIDTRLCADGRISEGGCVYGR